MNVKSTYKYARISPFKAREVAREIQGLPVSVALDILTFTQRKAARLIGKTMKAAIADAENNFELDLETLTVKEAVIGDGPTFKRFKPRARGSASPIRKRTAHIYVTLPAEAPLPEPKQKSSGAKKKKATAAKKKTAPAKKEAAAKKDEDTGADDATEVEAKVDDAAVVEVAEAKAPEVAKPKTKDEKVEAPADEAAAETPADADSADADKAPEGDAKS
jgi:large subunit ribosomal protein L22